MEDIDMVGMQPPIPDWIAHMMDAIFEKLPAERTIYWTREVVAEIRLQADYSLVVPKLMLRGIQDVWRYADDATLPGIERVIKYVLEPRARGEVVTEEVEAAVRMAAGKGAAWATPRVSETVGAAIEATYASAPNAWSKRATEAFYHCCMARKYYEMEVFLQGRGVWGTPRYAAEALTAEEWSFWLLELLREAPVIKEEEEEV